MSWSWYESLCALPMAMFISDCVYGGVSIGGAEPDPGDYSFWLLI